MSNNLNILWGSKSLAGKAIEHNPETVLEFEIPEGHLFLVTRGIDGESGHGALAAKMLSEGIKKYFHNQSYKDMAQALTNAITYASYTIFEQASKNEKYKGMGATLAIVICHKDKIYYAYAGDSRIYLVSSQSLQALTQDHVSEGKLFNILGQQKDARFGVSKTPIEARAGQQFLICTKGLTDTLCEKEIIEVLDDENQSAEHKIHQLTDLALARSVENCYSSTLVTFTDKTMEQKSKKGKTKSNISWVKASLYAMILVMFAIVLKWAWVNNFWSDETPALPAENKTEQTPIADNVKEVAEPEAPKTTKEQSAEETIQQSIEESVKQNIANQQVVAQKSNTQAIASTHQSGDIMHKHTVAAGENLFRLGLRYHVSQDKIIEINGDKARKLVAGSTLQIPVTAEHTVSAGETIQGISTQYGVSTKLIIQASAKTSEQLKVGENLIIPNKTLK